MVHTEIYIYKHTTQVKDQNQLEFWVTHELLTWCHVVRDKVAKVRAKSSPLINFSSFQFLTLEMQRRANFHVLTTMYR